MARHHAPPAASDDLTMTSATGSTTMSSSDSLASDLTSVANDAISALTSFLDKLRDASKSSSLYGASGGTASKLASVLVNAIA